MVRLNKWWNATPAFLDVHRIPGLELLWICLGQLTILLCPADSSNSKFSGTNQEEVTESLHSGEATGGGFETAPCFTISAQFSPSCHQNVLPRPWPIWGSFALPRQKN